MRTRLKYTIFTIVLTRVQSDILVDDTGHARITDFGLSTVTQDLDSAPDLSEGHGYSIRWNPPEILSEGGTYGKEADIFSFAMVMIEVSYEWVICAELWLSVISYHHRYLMGRLLSPIHSERLCWQ